MTIEQLIESKAQEGTDPAWAIAYALLRLSYSIELHGRNMASTIDRLSHNVGKVSDSLDDIATVIASEADVPDPPA
jgi:hypothetical protein